MSFLIQDATQLAELSLLAKMVDHDVDPHLIIGELQGNSSRVHYPITLQEFGNGWTLFTFTDKEDIDYVWENRPYYVEGHLLALYRWTDNFVPSEAETTRVDLWARIPSLPLSLFRDQALQSLLRENNVGDLIRIDDLSNVDNKMNFVRFCVNVDISRPLLRRVTFRNEDGSLRQLKVWYEDYSPGCGCCGDDHHEFDDCPLHTVEPRWIQVVLDDHETQVIEGMESNSDTQMG